MSNYELQNLVTQHYYDEAIRSAEPENREILSPVVAGSRLHQVMLTLSTAESTRAESKPVCTPLTNRLTVPRAIR
jgi:hypothetical protein